MNAVGASQRCAVCGQQLGRARSGELQLGGMAVMHDVAECRIVLAEKLDVATEALRAIRDEEYVDSGGRSPLIVSVGVKFVAAEALRKIGGSS
jgi:hypothetical protein